MKFKIPYKVNNCYYENCCYSDAMIEVLKDIKETQKESFPVRVRLIYLDKDGNSECMIGIIKGVLDNGDETYIDAETIEYIQHIQKSEEKEFKEK